jgi:hypothetical protein
VSGEIEQVGQRAFKTMPSDELARIGYGTEATTQNGDSARNELMSRIIPALCRSYRNTGGGA